MAGRRTPLYAPLILAALVVLATAVWGQVSATAGASEPYAEIEALEVGYDEGFDFEALGVMGTTWRLGMTYYQESLFGAQLLDEAIDAFLAAPGPETLARTPYLRTEVFRFVLPQVAAWEGRVNAWPLDEGLVDYVASPLDDSENPLANANLIASTELLVDGQTLDASVLTQDLLDVLSEAGGGGNAEKNVTAGYHAIEFMLWGQDLNGTAPGPAKGRGRILPPTRQPAATATVSDGAPTSSWSRSAWSRTWGKWSRCGGPGEP